MMVRIPFRKDFKKPLLNGDKTWTSRRKRYGKPGDYFPAYGQLFRIQHIRRMKLKVVADNFDKEGCASREDFIEKWRRIYYGGFKPEQQVYVHVFKKIEKLNIIT